MEAVRDALAAKHGADATCPLTAGGLARIADEYALERLAAGADIDEIAPFWRAIDPASPLARKLSCGRDFIRQRRVIEGKGEADAKPGAARPARKTARPSRRAAQAKANRLRSA
jgi:hypothetical protein